MIVETSHSTSDASYQVRSLYCDTPNAMFDCHNCMSRMLLKHQFLQEYSVLLLIVTNDSHLVVCFGHSVSILWLIL